MIYKILSAPNLGTLYPDFKQISLQTTDRKRFLAAKGGNGRFDDSWVELDGLLEDGTPVADISRLSGFQMVLSPRAQQALLPQLAELGECLPLTFGGETYQLFNCTLELDAVDEANSRLNDFDEIISLSLDPERIGGQLLWGIRFGVGRGLFCGEAFKQQVEAAGLSGLSFSTDLAARS